MDRRKIDIPGLEDEGAVLLDVGLRAALPLTA
jgi:hypothetical protein